MPLRKLKIWNRNLFLQGEWGGDKFSRGGGILSLWIFFKNEGKTEKKVMDTQEGAICSRLIPTLDHDWGASFSNKQILLCPKSWGVSLELSLFSQLLSHVPSFSPPGCFSKIPLRGWDIWLLIFQKRWLLFVLGAFGASTPYSQFSLHVKIFLLFH